jgi:hypothetical protein
MSVKRFTIWAVVAVCIFAVRAAAQKNELSGMIGRTLIGDQNLPGAPSYDSVLRFGDGLTVEVNYSRRLMGRELFSLSLEVPLVVNADEDLHSSANPFLSYRSYFLTPAARFNAFPEQAVSPWVSAGGGFGHFSGNSGSSEISTSNTTAVLQVGVGLDVKFYKHFGLRGEARDFWSGVPQLNLKTGNNRQSNIFVAGGVVWHF